MKNLIYTGNMQDLVFFKINKRLGYFMHLENIDVSIIKSVCYGDAHLHREHARSFNLICTVVTSYSNKLFRDVRYGHSTHAMDSKEQI